MLKATRAGLIWRIDGRLVALSFGLFIIGIDYTVLNVAMLDIRDSLGAGLEALEWIFGVFSLVSGATVLAVGAAADRLGRRRVYVTGVVWFTLSSALCAMIWRSPGSSSRAPRGRPYGFTGELAFCPAPEETRPPRRSSAPGMRVSAERTASKLAFAVSVSSPTPQAVSSPMLSFT
jgi:hypothetical protein